MPHKSSQPAAWSVGGRSFDVVDTEAEHDAVVQAVGRNHRRVRLKEVEHLLFGIGNSVQPSSSTMGVRPKTSLHSFFIAVNWSGSRMTPCQVMPSICIGSFPSI